MADERDGDEVLRRVVGKRGYRLSYHRMLAAADPGLLAAYDAFYERLTLRPRVLTPASRELVWTALQAATREAQGTIHLKRADEAGVARPLLADAVALCAAVETWPALVGFGGGQWSEWIPEAAALTRYRALFDAARGGIVPATAELIAIVCHGARRTLRGLKLHLPPAFAAGATRDGIAEALSYILLPAGGPTLIEAVEAWAEAAEEGICPSPYAD